MSALLVLIFYMELHILEIIKAVILGVVEGF